MAKGSKRFTCEFEGMDELITRITKLGGNANVIAEKALKKSHEYVTPKLHEEMNKHRRTGDTELSIKDVADITWEGNIAGVGIGFDISNKGLPSVFLMHGVDEHKVLYGTARTPKDQKLYNAIYGKSTINQVREIQQNVFYEELRKLEK